MNVLKVEHGPRRELTVTANYLVFLTEFLFSFAQIITSIIKVHSEGNFFILLHPLICACLKFAHFCALEVVGEVGAAWKPTGLYTFAGHERFYLVFFTSLP